MLFIEIRYKSTKNTKYLCNIRMGTYYDIHKTTNNTRIGNIWHMISILSNYGGKKFKMSN